LEFVVSFFVFLVSSSHKSR